MSKQSSAKLSSLAARILKGYVPTHDEVMALAASVLSQDETKGQSRRATKGQDRAGTDGQR